MLNPILYNEILCACFTRKTVMDKAISANIGESFFASNSVHSVIYDTYKELYIQHGGATKSELIDALAKKEHVDYLANKTLKDVNINDAVSKIYETPFQESLILSKMHETFIKANYDSLMDTTLKSAASSKNIIKDLYLKTKEIYSTAETIIAPVEKKVSFLLRDDKEIQANIRSYMTADDVIKTGWPTLDTIFGHGISRYGELLIYLGPPNRGKTAILLAHAINCMYLGYKCLFITGETTVPVLEKRLYAAISHTPIGELSRNPEIVLKRMALLRKLGGGLQFDSFVGNSFYTPDDMEKSIIKYKKESGIDIVFVDYFDKMTVNRGSKTTEPRLKLAEITQEGRNIALRNFIPIVTVSQTNRAGANTPLITEENISEDFTKVAIADRIVSLNSTYEDYTNNLMRLFVLKNRDGVKNQLIEYHADFKSMIFRDAQLIDVNDYLRRHQAQLQDRQRDRHRARQQVAGAR